MKLTQRLIAIAQFIPRGSTVIDVGTDHALLPIYLLQNQISKWVIASDINPGPLDSARKNIAAAGLDGAISLRLGNGLDIVNGGEAEVCIVAGMGGSTIRDIIKNAGEKAREFSLFVLQPMGSSGGLRTWLVDNGWRIDNEELIPEDRRLYEIIVAVPGEEKTVDQTVISVGPRLFEKRHPLLASIIAEEIRQNNNILQCLDRTESMDAVAKRSALTQRNLALERILECL